MQPQPFSTSPPQPPTPQDGSGRIKPSGWWYVVGGAFALVGIGVGVWLMVSAVVRYTDRIDSFARVDVPGSAAVQLDGTGGYTVYYEHTFLSDRFNRSPVDVEITAPDGSDVELRRYGSDVTYTSGSRNGRALYSFRVDQPGRYEVTVNGERGTVAIGRGLGRDMASRILGGIVVGVVGVVVGLVVVVVVAIKRGSSKRRLAPPVAASGWGGGAGGYASGPMYPGPGAPPPGAPPTPPPPPPGSPPSPQ